ncbi:dystrobrevin beta-like isoform X4 [Neocloeon triangulifer]|uniref:dystrobrevin beta-like isoform X4 n=1 Tax=Neocloeon triangulifer TaxID=2078957 RepID=UPI00286F9593|nr:dystrobrevin beta-like isoform X4 [Neocloeon triangulifer]
MAAEVAAVESICAGHRQLIQEMRAQNLDMIRFSSYRTACKLRYVQKKTNLHIIDIWNVIEAFREHGLNTLEPQAEVNVSRLETLLSSLLHNLNKRLPAPQQVQVDACSSLLLNWLLAAYSVENVGRIRVFSIKVALASMCAGKLMDKLRYIFSQISDGNGHMLQMRFSEYLQEVLALPAAVYESPSFSYSDMLEASIFSGAPKVTVNDFMDVMMSDPGPHCLVWLPLLHRLASVEQVAHPMICDACQRENFTGFRYRCQKCHNYNMCQECFWRGRISGQHTNEHEVKEYSTYKSPSKQIGHSLRKSFRCVPEKGRNNIPRFPDEPEKTLNLSHIVPPSPLPTHNGFPDGSSFSGAFDVGSMDSRSTHRSFSPLCSSPSKYNTTSLDSARFDDEHKLIARYAARLAAEARSANRAPSEANLSIDTSRAQRELIQQLESKNREIMREIARLRRQQELETAGMSASAEENPALMAELRALRQRKGELEGHLTALQDSRRQLMVQLEGLMKLLKNHQPSPRSTPNSSPRSTKSPPLPSSSMPMTGSLPSSSRSAPVTPGGLSSSMSSMANSVPGGMADSLAGDVRSAFGGQQGPPPPQRSLRNDLLVAADSVTCAMSTLVRELNSDFEADDEDQDEFLSRTANGNTVLWREEMQKRFQQEQLMAEIQARTHGNNGDFGDNKDDFDDDEDTDVFGQNLQALLRSQREEINQKENGAASAADWEDAMKRWTTKR